MRKTVCFITSAYNVSSQLEECYDSLKEQTNSNWEWVILNDMSNDNTFELANKIASSDERERVTVINHDHKKFALKGICDYLQEYNDFSEKIIAILNGGDALCNENTVELVLKEYDKNTQLEALWTAHSWDINGMNISRELPEKINPYQYPWVSSHLKTFKVNVFKKIKKENFQDLDGNWFERGCDQALYLPILHLAKDRKFLNEICYLHSFRLKANREVNLIRSRGFIE